MMDFKTLAQKTTALQTNLSNRYRLNDDPQYCAVLRLNDLKYQSKSQVSQSLTYCTGSILNDGSMLIC